MPIVRLAHVTDIVLCAEDFRFGKLTATAVMLEWSPLVVMARDQSDKLLLNLPVPPRPRSLPNG